VTPNFNHNIYNYNKSTPSKRSVKGYASPGRMR